MELAPRLTVHVDSVDRRLLAELDSDPTASFRALSEALSVSPRTAARRFERLAQARAVRIVGRTLPGFEGHLGRIVRVYGAPDRLNTWARELAREETTRWVRLSREGTELMCGFVSPPTREDPAMHRLLSADDLRRVETHELLHVWAGRAGLTVRPERDLDRTDRRLLSLLAENGRAGAAALAHALGTDPSTVSRRRARLIDDGILYFEADIHPDALGGSGDAMLWIRARPGGLHDLGRRLRDLRSTRFAAATSGSVSLVAHVSLPTNSSLVSFVDSELDDPRVQNVEIVPMGQVLKRYR